MQVDEFYSLFEGLDSEVVLLRDEIKLLGGTLERKIVVQEVLNGLRSTPGEEDPGKYRPAYYFLTSDGRKVNVPSLFSSCPQCGTEQPVLMRYVQTHDSPSGDVWEKCVFVMCAEDGAAYMIKREVHDHRF